jgi:hypothetical protein
MDFDEALDGAAAVCLVLPRCRRVLRGRSAIAVAAVMLPIGNPVNEHLPDLHIRNRHLLDGVHFQCGRMQHLLNGARGGFEDAEGYHLV